MTRILAVNWQDMKHPASGGAELHLIEILKRLTARGYEVDWLCCGFENAPDRETYDGINIIRYGSRSTFNYVMPFAYRKLAAENNYDIVFEDINKVPFYMPIYSKLPSIVIFHHLFGGSIFREINFLLGSYIYLSEMPLAAVYGRKQIMAVSESTAGELIKKGLSEERIKIIYNGVDSEVYNYDPEIPKYTVPTLLYVGRIKKYKSLETAIEAMPVIRAQIPEARLIIVGDGDHLPALKEKVQVMKLTDCIKFTGFVDEDPKVEYYRKSHLLVYPSFKEGWGLTNIEANACGTPTLASRVPGLRDSVAEGKSGFLFEYGIQREYADKAIQLLTDNELRTRLEKGALLHASQFSWDKVTDDMEELVNRVIAAK